jgi:DNA-binding CsgD family transcriptional regulator
LLRISSRSQAGVAPLRLVLDPLDVAETEKLVSSMLSGATVSRPFAQLLHDHTEGVPLAVEESLRLMHQRADLLWRDGGWVRRRLDDVAVPPTVRDAVLERVDRLGADARLVARAAAVLAEPTAEATLLAVTGLAEQAGRGGLGEVIGCGLVVEDGHGMLGFRHSLACTAVHESIPAPLRRELHERAGTVLAALDPAPLARVARHYRAAGDDARWTGYAEQAAQLALEAGDDTTAATLLHDLLTSGQLPAASVIRLTRSLPYAAFTGTERFETLVHALQNLLDRGRIDESDAAQIRFQMARALVILGRYETAKAVLERAVPHLTPGSAEAARALIYLGLPLGDIRPAEWHLQWLRQADAPMSLPEDDQMQLLVDRATALLLLGEDSGWEAARRIPHHPAGIAQRRHVVTGLANIGHFAMMWGRYSESEQVLVEALQRAEEYDYPATRNVIRTTQIHLRWHTGRWAGLAEQARSYADDDQLRPSVRAEAAFVAGMLEAAAGESSSAQARLQMAYTEGYESRAVERFLDPAAGLARLWRSEGRPAEAFAITDEPVDITVGKGIWVCGTEVVAVRTVLLADAGRLDEGDALVARYGELVAGHDAPAAHAALLGCRAVLARARAEHSRAAELFALAAHAWQALPRSYDALLCQEERAGCLLAAGHADAGLALLTEVFHGLSDLGARRDATRVMHTLRGHGVDVKRPWWGGRRGYGDQLSPRELDVARLLVGGRTNREIAAALFLSPKTVARHVDAAMRKLDAGSRTALAVKLVEADIVTAPAPEAPVS